MFFNPGPRGPCLTCLTCFTAEIHMIQMSSSSAEASEPPIHLNQLCFEGKGRAGKHLKQAGQATPRTKIGKSNAPDIGKKLNNFLNTKSRFRNQIINSGIVR